MSSLLFCVRVRVTPIRLVHHMPRVLMLQCRRGRHGASVALSRAPYDRTALNLVALRLKIRVAACAPASVTMRFSGECIRQQTWRCLCLCTWSTPSLSALRTCLRKHISPDTNQRQPPNMENTYSFADFQHDVSKTTNDYIDMYTPSQKPFELVSLGENPSLADFLQRVANIPNPHSHHRLASHSRVTTSMAKNC